MRSVDQLISEYSGCSYVPDLENLLVNSEFTFTSFDISSSDSKSALKLIKSPCSQFIALVYSNHIQIFRSFSIHASLQLTRPFTITSKWGTLSSSQWISIKSQSLLVSAPLSFSPAIVVFSPVKSAPVCSLVVPSKVNDSPKLLSCHGTQSFLIGLLSRKLSLYIWDPMQKSVPLYSHDLSKITQQVTRSQLTPDPVSLIINDQLALILFSSGLFVYFNFIDSSFSYFICPTISSISGYYSATIINYFPCRFLLCTAATSLGLIDIFNQKMIVSVDTLPVSSLSITSSRVDHSVIYSNESLGISVYKSFKLFCVINSNCIVYYLDRVLYFVIIFPKNSREIISSYRISINLDLKLIEFINNKLIMIDVLGNAYVWNLF
ncbi:hypothetical protein RCL1_007814 [Eukaryota sp. TZLM3-RCL]